MRNRFLFLSVLIATLTALAPTSFGQGEQIDAVTQIDGETLPSDASKVYFNAENCAAAGTTLYDVTLTNGDGVTVAYMWAGVQNGECEQNEKRTAVQNLCRPMASSTPATVNDNFTVFDLTLQELVDTGVVDCNNTALVGQPYWIYSFRTSDPGGMDVLPEGYGIAEFWVDVTPPDELVLTSDPNQAGSRFTISWNSPADSTSIQLYKLYRSDTGDLADVVDTTLTEVGTKTTFSVDASTLNLAPGDSTNLYVSAVDMAAVTPGNGNEGQLSQATLVTSEETLGFCDDPNVDCSGCSISPMTLASGHPGNGVWFLGLLFAVVCGWRLRL